MSIDVERLRAFVTNVRAAVGGARDFRVYVTLVDLEHLLAVYEAARVARDRADDLELATTKVRACTEPALAATLNEAAEREHDAWVAATDAVDAAVDAARGATERDVLRAAAAAVEAAPGHPRLIELLGETATNRRSCVEALRLLAALIGTEPLDVAAIAQWADRSTAAEIAATLRRAAEVSK